MAREKAQAEAARERQRADELERRLAASAESKEAATLEYAKNICIQMFLMGAADEGLQQLLPVAAACFGFSAAELQRVRDASAAAAAEASGGILGLLTPAKARPVDLPALTPRPTDADAARRIDRLKALLIASQAHIEQFQRRDASRGAALAKLREAVSVLGARLDGLGADASVPDELVVGDDDDDEEEEDDDDDDDSDDDEEEEGEAAGDDGSFFAEWPGEGGGGGAAALASASADLGRELDDDERARESLHLALAMRDAPGHAAALTQMRRRGHDRGMDAQAVAAAERALRERR